MELRHFRYFLAVAREAQFARAAAGLNITQPALSKQIQDLEEQIGTPLFRRTTRRVELTPAGLAFQAEAERALFQAELAVQAARETADGVRGTLRVGLAGSVPSARIVSDLRRFTDAQADISVWIDNLPPAEQIDAIETGQLDVAYQPALGFEVGRNVRCVTIEQWPWVLAVPAGGPLAATGVTALSDITDQTFVMYTAVADEPNARELIKQLLGYIPRRLRFAQSPMAVLSMVAAGSGIAFLPAPLALVHMPGVSYNQVASELAPLNLLMIWRSGSMRGVTRTFLDSAGIE